MGPSCPFRPLSSQAVMVAAESRAVAAEARAVAAEAHATKLSTSCPAVTVTHGITWVGNLDTRCLSDKHLVKLEAALGNLQQKLALEKARRELNAEESNNCVVCFSAPRAVVLLDCGHFVACERCAGTFDLCPVCRQHVREHRRVFSG